MCPVAPTTTTRLILSRPFHDAGQSHHPRSRAAAPSALGPGTPLAGRLPAGCLAVSPVTGGSARPPEHHHGVGRRHVLSSCELSHCRRTSLESVMAGLTAAADRGAGRRL